MKRAIAIAIAAICAAPAALAWHCSALNRTYPLPIVIDEEVPATNLTMATKEGIVAAGSGLEWITNVALFAHGRNPTNYAKLVSHTLNTSLLPKAYHDWMFGQVRDIFTRYWGGTYPDGSSNTVEVLGLHYTSPFDVGSDDYDFQEMDLRHNFESGAIWRFSAESGNSPLTVAASNSVRRILGRDPAVFRPGPYYLDISVGASTFPYSWLLVQNGLSSGYVDLKYILNAGTPAYTVYGTTPLRYVNLGFKFHGPSPLSVETKTYRYTTRAQYLVTVVTNSDCSAVVSSEYLGALAAKSTNLTHTVSRVPLGQPAVAKATAFGYPGSIVVESPTKVFPYGAPVYHIFNIDGENVGAACYQMYYAWKYPMQFVQTVEYVLEYTLSRVCADYPPGRTVYPPALAGASTFNPFHTWAFVPYCATADGSDYDLYDYYDHEKVESGVYRGHDNGATGDAFRLACAQAIALTNACQTVTDEMYNDDGVGWQHPIIEHSGDADDYTFYPQPCRTDKDSHDIFLCFDQDDGHYLGTCTTNNWELSREMVTQWSTLGLYQVPPYEEQTSRPIYDAYHGNYPWELELKVDMDAYGSWDFNNWLR